MIISLADYINIIRVLNRSCIRIDLDLRTILLSRKNTISALPYNQDTVISMKVIGILYRWFLEMSEYNESHIDSDISFFLDKILDAEDNSQFIDPISRSFGPSRSHFPSAEQCACLCILNYSELMSSLGFQLADPISELCSRLVIPDEDSQVIDISPNKGLYLYSRLKNPLARITGTVSNRFERGLLKICSSLISDVGVINETRHNDNSSPKSTNAWLVLDKEESLNSNSGSENCYSKINTVIDAIGPDGLGLVVLETSALWLSKFKSRRKQLLESGYIKAIISLARDVNRDSKTSHKMSAESKRSSLSIIILSNNNKCVRMVDATEQFSFLSNNRYLSESDIQLIVNSLNSITNISLDINNEEIAAKDFNLNPAYYSSLEEQSGNSYKTVKEITHSIIRGLPLRSAVLQRLRFYSKSNGPSEGFRNIYYVTRSDISCGIISSDTIPEPETMYLPGIEYYLVDTMIEDGDIILTRNSYPFRASVCHVKDGEIMLPADGLIVLKLNRELVDPYYVLAFLNSTQGDLLLKSTYQGNGIPTLSVENLKDVKIPILPLEEQIAIGMGYMKIQDEISILEKDLNRAKYQRSALFDDDEPAELTEAQIERRIQAEIYTKQRRPKIFED